MELIDANELRDCFNINENCEECCFNNHGDCDDKVVFTRLDVCKKIDDVDIIKAIPIDWLRDKARDGFDGLSFCSVVETIESLIDEWERENKEKQDEAEVHNEEKFETWKSLGHIIGYMNHPYSEYFKCSLCGYEQYVVFDGPSNKCPNCKANMKME